MRGSEASDPRGETAGHLPAVAILADDLIWGERLRRLVVEGGARVVAIRSAEGLRRALGAAAADRPRGLVVDLTARAFDPLDAISVAAEAGIPTVAVGQHDDVATRERARAAGASHVFAYGHVHRTGSRTVTTWVAEVLGGPMPAGPAGRAR